MLSAQLVGRLLPEIEHSDNIRNLLRQCDAEGIQQNALVPSYHCMHTPGGPLKYSLEGHQFAIFAMKLTSDNRYIISCSNKFITFDTVTSDLARQVYPKVQGLMMGLELSPDNKFAAAYTNNNQTILLNTLISEFIIIENFLSKDEMVQGVCVLDSNVVIYGQYNWCIFDLKGVPVEKRQHDGPGQILSLAMINSLDKYAMISWSGKLESPDMVVTVNKEGVRASLEGHSVVCTNKMQDLAFLCDTPGSNTIAMYRLKGSEWVKQRSFKENTTHILMLALSKTEAWCCATVLNGFKLWHLESEKHQYLALPHGVRNITKRFNLSSSIVLSKGDKLAVTGIRNELLCWDMETGCLVKQMVAHFQRIVDIQSLVAGPDNLVATSSIDRCIKIWNLEGIFEKERHIDKHELTIESLSISTSKGLAVVVTRSCIGVWDFMTGKLKFTLANSGLGTIITHALVNEEASYIVAVDSGDVVYWHLERKEVIFKEKQPDVQQLFLYAKQKMCIAISRQGSKPHVKCLVVSRTLPDGLTQWTFEFPIQDFRSVVMTADERNLVCLGVEKLKPAIFIHSAKTGARVNIIPIKYPGFKDIIRVVALPDKSNIIGLIDIDKGNLMDIQQQKYLKSIPLWDGTFSSDGRYGLSAPATGGMDMLDLRTGKVSKTLIPKVAEGIFDVQAIFNATNEYVLYYHSGHKTIRAFRRKDGKMIANFRVQADLKGMETTTDGRSVVLGMGDGSMTTLTIADPAKEGIVDYLRTLPSRNPPGVRKGEAPGIRTGYLQNGVAYPSPYDFSIYTDYLKVNINMLQD